METLRCIPDSTLKLCGTVKEWHGEKSIQQEPTQRGGGLINIEL
jgi:hypothetical protein